MLSGFIIFVLIVLLGLSLWKNIKFGMTILRMEDTVEESLDIIDKRYEKMSEILTRPLFFDSAEVRQVVSEIKTVRDSLHAIAISLTENVTENELKEDNE